MKIPVSCKLILLNTICLQEFVQKNNYAEIFKPRDYVSIQREVILYFFRIKQEGKHCWSPFKWFIELLTYISLLINFVLGLLNSWKTQYINSIGNDWLIGILIHSLLYFSIFRESGVRRFRNQLCIPNNISIHFQESQEKRRKEIMCWSYLATFLMLLSSVFSASSFAL